MIMPSHAKNVKHYQDALPLFARYQVESYLGGMFNPTVQLKSGGYIVIGVTEALVAIDVNSGKATKEGSIEETALKTNLEAAEEVARQLRLRDLAGLIVIDFIDMDERKNNNAVEKRMKDKLKTDRARIQVGRISGFGLLEMSRQRLRPGMIEATTQPCPHCHGTGLLRSDDNLALAILRQLEEEGVRGKSKEVLVRAPVAIANYLMNQKREHVAMIEGRYGLSVRIEGDPMLVSPDFAIEKFKTATRAVAAVETPVVSVDTMIMDAIDAETEEPEETPEVTEEDAPKKKRRRRRRRRKGGGSGDESTESTDATATEETSEDAASESAQETAPEEAPAEDEKPKKTRSRRSRSRSKKTEEAAASTEEAKAEEAVAEETQSDAASEGEAAPAEEAAPEAVEVVNEEPVADSAEAVADEPTPEPVEAAPEVAAEPVAEEKAVEPSPEPAVAEAAPEAVSAAVVQNDEPPKPKRRGWWSR